MLLERSVFAEWEFSFYSSGNFKKRGFGDKLFKLYSNNRIN